MQLAFGHVDVDDRIRRRRLVASKARKNDFGGEQKQLILWVTDNSSWQAPCRRRKANEETKHLHIRRCCGRDNHLISESYATRTCDKRLL